MKLSIGYVVRPQHPLCGALTGGTFGLVTGMKSPVFFTGVVVLPFGLTSARGAAIDPLAQHQICAGVSRSPFGWHDKIVFKPRTIFCNNGRSVARLIMGRCYHRRACPLRRGASPPSLFSGSRHEMRSVVQKSLHCAQVHRRKYVGMSLLISQERTAFMRHIYYVPRLHLANGSCSLYNKMGI